MDVKEKLVELLDMNCGYVAEMRADKLADHLIQNGVTVQEWISVNDRLPEPGDYDYYLIQARFTINGDYTIPRVAKFRDGKWFVLDYDDKSFEDFLMTVTHWMPLTGLLRGGKNDA